jgi:calpain-15
LVKTSKKEKESDSEHEIVNNFLEPKFSKQEDQAPSSIEQHMSDFDLNSLLESSQKYTETLQKLTSATPKKHFLDPIFPSNTDSIVGFSDVDRDLYEHSVVWLRPNLFGFNNKKVTIYDTLDYSTIQQGKIGDCYFLAACCSLAQTPKRLAKLFLTGKNWQESGLHAIALNLNGFWEEVLVDDLFPCSTETGWPIFTTSSDGNLWIMLLEKAWAKVHGGYWQIKTGFSREALRDLSGAPTKSFFFKKSNTNKFWNELVNAFKSGFAVCSSSFNWKKKENKKWLLKHGLRTSHAYSVLDSFELKHQGICFINFLKIRANDENAAGERSLGSNEMEREMVSFR